MWGLPREGEEEEKKDDGPGGGLNNAQVESNMLDLDEIIKQQYEQQGVTEQLQVGEDGQEQVNMNLNQFDSIL